MTKRNVGSKKLDAEKSQDSELTGDSVVDSSLVAVSNDAAELVQDVVVKPEPLVYFGPTLPNGKLSQFTVFRGGLPRHVDELVKSLPVLQLLFVHPSKLNLSRVKLADSSSPEWASFQEVKAHFNKGVR
jgi:hypothetical protein